MKWLDIFKITERMIEFLELLSLLLGLRRHISAAALFRIIYLDIYFLVEGSSAF